MMSTAIQKEVYIWKECGMVKIKGQSSIALHYKEKEKKEFKKWKGVEMQIIGLAYLPTS